MAKGESSTDISADTELSDEPESNAAEIDFRPEANPAKGDNSPPPESLLTSTDTTEDYLEMDFRQLAETISWGDTEGLTHGIHEHPAIFIPHIPRFLINTFSDEENEDGERPVILDPFCGSGTTGVESKLAGRDFLGVEINPLSKLVSDVACTPIPYTVLRNAKQELNERLDDVEVRYYEEYDVEFLDQTRKDHWFEEEAIEGLTTVRKVVSEFLEDHGDLLRGMEPRERRAVESEAEVLSTHVPRGVILMIANTVFEVSNADPNVSKAHKSKKMRRRIDEETHPPDTLEVFREQLEQSVVKLIDLWNEVYATNVPGGSDYTVTIDGAENTTLHRFSDNWVPPEENPSHNAEVRIQLGDARTFEFPEYEEQVDMAITSPPYINAINYYRGTKLRLFWIQDLLRETVDIDADELRRSFIGTNSSKIGDLDGELPFTIHEKWRGDLDEFAETSLPDLDKDILEIHTGDLTEAKSRAYTTWKFFAEDMLQMLTRVYMNLKPGAYFFFVVGENTISGRRIQSHRYVADIAQHLGQFEQEDVDLDPEEGYRLAGMAWDDITRRDLFESRDHENGVIEREWVVVLQKPRS